MLQVSMTAAVYTVLMDVGASMTAAVYTHLMAMGGGMVKYTKNRCNGRL